MSLEKGAAWGEPGRIPGDVVPCADDAAVASAGGAGRVVMSTGGDLHRGLGSPRTKNTGDECVTVPVDLMRILVEMTDGTEVVHVAVAHVCVGRFGARAGFRGLVNAGFVEGLNLAPRGHPGDGRVELVTMDAKVPWRQRRMARRRAVTGTHVPHPRIHVAPCETWHSDVDIGDLRVDGMVVPGAARISVEIEPGRVRVAV